MVKDEIIMEEDMHLMEDDDGLTLDDFGPGNFVKNPVVGDNITFTVLKIKNNPVVKGTNKDTGAEFDIGLRDKKGNVKRFDIETDMGVYTVKPWEVFFKLFGKDGILTTYAKAHGKKFTGAKVSITRLEDGSHAQTKLENLAKILGVTLNEAKTYQERIQKALKEKRLFDVKIVN